MSSETWTPGKQEENYSSPTNSLPTVGVADAGGRIPGDSDHLAVALLYPHGTAAAEMNNGAQRYAAIQPVQHFLLAGVAGDAALDPGVAGDDFSLGQVEVLHHTAGFCVFAQAGVKEPVGSAVLVGVTERQLVADGAFLQESEGVTDADVVVRPGKKSGPIKVRPEHDKKVRTGPSRFVRGSGGLRMNDVSRKTEKNQHQGQAKAQTSSRRERTAGSRSGR